MEYSTRIPNIHWGNDDLFSYKEQEVLWNVILEKRRRSSVLG